MPITHEALVPEAAFRAQNIQRDFRRAIGLYAVGNRSDLVVGTMIEGIECFREANWPLPMPIPSSEGWNQLVDKVDSALAAQRCGEVA